MNNLTEQKIPEAPKRKSHDWFNAVMKNCDHCGAWKSTVQIEDHNSCASCCDETRLTDWQNYAEKLAALLKSARAELAAIKGAQQPVAWGLVDKHGNAYMSECCIGEEGDMKYEAETQNDYAESEDDFISAVPLFTHPAPLKE